MSIAEFIAEKQTEKCGSQLSIKHSLPSYDYIDSVKTYYLEVCSEGAVGTDSTDSAENSVFGWSLTNPHTNGYCEVHNQPVSINCPKVTLTPSADTRSCRVTIDPCNIFRTASSITVYVWNADNSAGESNVERGSSSRQSAKVSVSEIYIFKK